MKFEKGNLVCVDWSFMSGDTYQSYKVLTQIDIDRGDYKYLNKRMMTVQLPLELCKLATPESFGLKRGYNSQFSNKNHTKLITAAKYGKLKAHSYMSQCSNEKFRYTLEVKAFGSWHKVNASILEDQNAAIYKVYDILGNVLYKRAKVYNVDGIWKTYSHS